MATLIVPDVNVVVGAFHRDAPTHADDRAWLQARIAARRPIGLAEPVLLGFLRVVTHPRIFEAAAPLPTAVAFVDALARDAGSRSLPTTPSVWSRFRDLVASDPQVRGNLVPDAWIAALALAHGAAVATHDRGFARFEGLELVDPAT